MFPAENLRDWIGHSVVDPDGKTIGALEAIYVDTLTDEPSFFTVKVGFIGKHRLVFAPALGATVAPKHIRVRFAKDLVKDAPAIETDGELLAADEPSIFTHYDLDYGTGAERRLARR
ncbi:PRC-barrel domain-containing protein [Actinokineospora pegani]|uniref:PRC-barrel domain-containing protein n=1 Tax=Actinokineospora pegani TaxID=2654637 RepID=UPI0012E99AB3|nr:PRC-barrel domain-containing protein [Actinokineospora pegani]